MVAQSRDDLHALVEALPETTINIAGQILAALVRDDPVALSLILAPEDDEPETEEERAAVAEANAASARGEVLTTDQLRRQLGL